ncbi:protein kinase domain-containing protein [Streptomyces sp. NPDC054933]
MIERVELITCGGRSDESSVFEIEFEEGEHTRSGFRERHGVLVHGGGEQVVQRLAYTDQARRELGRAVKTGSGLERRLGRAGYPPELSRVVGYQLDGRVPFLLSTRRGRPLAERAASLPLAAQELWPVVDGIIAVLARLAELRLVHRDITPGSLLWDGTAVQLGDFGLALNEGELRGAAVGSDPWRPPDQATGLGGADCRDDVYAAGAVIFQLATGEEITAAADMRGRVKLLDSTLSDLLEGVFTDTARERVSGFALRQRRRGSAGQTAPGDPWAPPRLVSRAQREHEARDNFRRLRQEQWEHRHKVLQNSRRPALPQALPPSPRTRVLVGLLALVVLVAAVVTAAVLA